MDILKLAEKGFELLQHAREILGEVQGAIADGKTALDSNSIDQLEAQLADEAIQTADAHQRLSDAITAARDRL